MHTSSFSPMENLRAEHQVIADLLDLMKQEQACLIDANVEGIKQLTEQKTKLVQMAADLAKQRHAALEKAGFKILNKNNFTRNIVFFALVSWSAGFCVFSFRYLFCPSTNRLKFGLFFVSIVFDISIFVVLTLSISVEKLD